MDGSCERSGQAVCRARTLPIGAILDMVGGVGRLPGGSEAPLPWGRRLFDWCRCRQFRTETCSLANAAQVDAIEELSCAWLKRQSRVRQRKRFADSETQKCRRTEDLVPHSEAGFIPVHDLDSIAALIFKKRTNSLREDRGALLGPMTPRREIEGLSACRCPGYTGIFE